MPSAAGYTQRSRLCPAQQAVPAQQAMPFFKTKLVVLKKRAGKILETGKLDVLQSGTLMYCAWHENVPRVHEAWIPLKQEIQAQHAKSKPFRSACSLLILYRGTWAGFSMACFVIKPTRQRFAKTWLAMKMTLLANSLPQACRVLAKSFQGCL